MGQSPLVGLALYKKSKCTRSLACENRIGRRRRGARKRPPRAGHSLLNQANTCLLSKHPPPHRPELTGQGGRVWARRHEEVSGHALV